ncbi:MAG: family 20 glycosylhydrolase [Armatimonadia bacterium]|nr:family 20 glycosylhydrolase [Armatimonadia bacterium]
MSYAYAALSLALLVVAARADLPAIIPEPREVVTLDGALDLAAPVDLVLDDVDAPAASRVIDDCLATGGNGTPVRLSLIQDPELGPEGYELVIGASGVEIGARTTTGLFYGAHTLRQIVEGSEGELPLCRIRDWPAMEWRGTGYTVTQPEQIRRVASLKLNLIVWEVSGQYESPSHPELAGDRSLRELAEICAEARRNHITLILEVQSFGHAHWLLIPHPEMRADPESTHTINPYAPGVYELLEDVYAELIPASGVPWFFPACDEPWQIDEWCHEQGLDPARVVGEHIARLAEIAGALGARIMVWGDYLLKYPEALTYFSPEDVVIVDWQYDPVEEYPSVDLFVEAGFETLVAPSTCPREPLFPEYDDTGDNIVHFVADGQRRGAIGMLNTNWPTGPIPFDALWYGWALGAEASWSDEPVDRAGFDQRYFRQRFGADTEAARELYFQWAEANSLWPRQPAPTAEQLLERLARTDAVGVHGMPGSASIEAVDALAERARELRENAADPDLRGWRDLASIAESITRSLYPQRRNGLIEEAYRRLVEAETAADREGFESALDAAGQALRAAQAALREDESTARRIVTAALARLDAAERPIDPAEILGLGTPARPVAAEVDVLACHRVLGEPELAPAPHGESGVIIPEAGTGVEVSFRVLRPGQVRIWALLRHSAGIWEDGRFARGGRNGVYDGKYGLRLDAQRLTETWFGEELNPDDDEALRWAVLYEGNLERGGHVLSFETQGVNWAIVERLVFTRDPGWRPE